MSEPAGTSVDGSAVPVMDRRTSPRRPEFETLVPTVVLGLLGLAVGLCVQGAIDWVNRASTDPNQYEGLGRGLVSVGVGAPVLTAVTLVAFRLLRVRLWLVAGLTALWLAVVATGIVTRIVTSTPGNTPVAWPWCTAAVFALCGLLFQLARPLLTTLVVVAVLVAFAVLSSIGTTRQRDMWQATAAASIRATGLPVLTTEVNGYTPASASGAPAPGSDPAGPEIILEFHPDPPSDQPYLDPSVRMHTFHRPAAFHPPEDCPTTNFVSKTFSPPCAAVAPDIWWSETSHSAIRDEGDDLVVLVADTLRPQAQEILVAAALRVHPTDIDTLVAHNN
jgi:hypothetical protein